MTVEMPEAIGQKYCEFLDAGKTGQIILNVHQGTVGSAQLVEHIRGTMQKNIDTMPAKT
jgi:hypothetical protein